jgi:3-oxoacyl-[acyl-carrier protein] reductase
MPVSIDLSSRHALVCGASSGIGRACAVALAEAGATLTVLARTESKLNELIEELRAQGAPAAHVIAVDMDDRPRLQAKVEAHLKQHGPIHVLVHNSGGPASGPILEKTEDDLLHTFGRHQLTAHLLVRLLLPGMKEAGYGRFVNILSTAAREPIDGLGLSNTVRAGIIGWAKTVANELPPGVTINNVLPGYTATERLTELKMAVAQRTGQTEAQVESTWVGGIPEGRLGQPEEIAHAVLFLASPLASYVRGSSLAVEGGRLKSL